jgi:hypothetical protein
MRILRDGDPQRTEHPFNSFDLSTMRDSAVIPRDERASSALRQDTSFAIALIRT